jgi:hypothetical protein
MSEATEVTTSDPTSDTPTKRAPRKAVPFNTVKQRYCKARGTTPDTQKGVNAM